MQTHTYTMPECFIRVTFAPSCRIVLENTVEKITFKDIEFCGFHPDLSMILKDLITKNLTIGSNTRNLTSLIISMPMVKVHHSLQ